MELRSVWNRGVLELSDEELNFLKSRLDENGIRISSIGSPIGKVDIKDDFENSLEKFKRAVAIALKMGTKNIRIFSFYIPRDEMDTYEPEVIRRMSILAKTAQINDLTVFHENEAGIFGETSDRCLKLFETVCDPNFKMVFDPSNFVAAGEDVYNMSFKRLKKHIAYLHIKDSLKSTGQIVIAGKGDGCIREILDELKDREGMFVSLEPHLDYAGQYRGFSGLELFLKDLKAFRTILNDLNIQVV